ncbi:50S ribosomal protein L13 [Candidatus Roizmanbacteria bacterium CG_4_10_14_3_um_filter_39_13]|uniref:Large ribosomal subunit protein uL13 n=2 Tax=Candidatus Roizmaniibacteriota TaxID=1752723 RepID=A0A2H0KKV2_9BACT|nr:MAG: 50S ribosomal protein L13 [Candidatus Roizmanbacteria bacterium CG11_big_fil_rev_8_21_14_0_20_37_16]PIX68669.1 MAG: 50S ribosomal protein L13 [Candidatus Roizmanbacteria bacterium CG_4_10_14_3_um_filter_39_13]
MSNLTKITKPISVTDIQQAWHLVDMKGKVLGRELPRISTLLQGKHKPTYVPNIDSGDYVVVINASHLLLTGDKMNTKMYDHFSGYPGGLKKTKASDLLEHSPARMVVNGVGGMLPKNKLRDKRLARLFVFADDKHPYTAEFAKK